MESTTPTAPKTLPVESTPKPAPEQVDEAVFLAARLRESMAEAANLRQLVAQLQVDNSQLRAQIDQAEIERLDTKFKVGAGTVLQQRPDGTFWRIPKELLKQPGQA